MPTSLQPLPHVGGTGNLKEKGSGKGEGRKSTLQYCIVQCSPIHLIGGSVHASLHWCLMVKGKGD